MAYKSSRLHDIRRDRYSISILGVVLNQFQPESVVYRGHRWPGLAGCGHYPELQERVTTVEDAGVEKIGKKAWFVGRG